MKKTLYVFVWACSALLALPAAAQVPGYVPTDGLVGWWPFNGNANDESGNGNDGTVNGATLTEDRFGNVGSAYSFDESNDFVTTNSSFYNPSTNHTLSMWFLIGDSLNLSNTLFNTNPHRIEGVGFNSYLLTQPGGFSYCFGDIVNWPLCGADYSFYPTFDKILWNNITVRKTDSVYDFFLNGELVHTQTDVNFIPDVNVDLWFGAISGGFSPPNEEWLGSLDDISIYNRALSQEEITALYTGEPVSPPTACTPLPTNLQEGLVGYWPFCGNANDESGNGNDGTVNGATLTEDRFGNAGSAYGFDGVDDFIELPNSYLIDSLYDFSVSAWVLSNNLNADFQHLISKDTMGPPPHGDWDFYLRNNRFKFEITLNSPTFEQQSNAVLQENTWHHLQMVREASSGVVSLYVNGVFDSSFIGHTGANYNFQKMVFGKQGSSNLHFFNGSLDDIAIYNRALTPEEVQQLYTLDACTFTVYDTSYVTVYDTLTTYETVYDTLYTYETIYDTVTTYVTVTDTLLIDITFTGIEGQPSWLNTVTVFPNPASDHITIDYGNFALLAGYNTIITDAAGATVYSSTVNSQQAYIDINAWGAAGVYYLTIYDAGGAPVAVRHIVLE